MHIAVAYDWSAWDEIRTFIELSQALSLIILEIFLPSSLSHLDSLAANQPVALDRSVVILRVSLAYPLNEEGRIDVSVGLYEWVVLDTQTVSDHKDHTFVHGNSLPSSLLPADQMRWTSVHFLCGDYIQRQQNLIHPSIFLHLNQACLQNAEEIVNLFREIIWEPWGCACCDGVDEIPVAHTMKGHLRVCKFNNRNTQCP